MDGSPQVVRFDATTLWHVERVEITNDGVVILHTGKLEITNVEDAARQPTKYETVLNLKTAMSPANCSK